MNNYGHRIKQIREFFCDNNNLKFAQKLGISASQSSALCMGKASLGKQTIEKILDAFPQVSRAWLMVGEGEMLTKETTNAVERASYAGPSARARANNISNEDDFVSIPLSVWSVIKQQAASLAAKDAQIDRMLDIIEKRTATSILPTLSAQVEQLVK